MAIAIVVLLLAAIGVLLSDSFVEIPAYHFGVVERFGKRTKRVMEEGLRGKLPFIDYVELISMELTEIDVDISFTTKDKLKLVCKGSLQYRPDPNIKDFNGRNVFIAMSEKIITSGIEDTVKGKLGALGGVKEGKEFIKSRHAIADMINCFFRLETSPHKDHEKPCEIPSCELPKGGQIDAAKLLEYYQTHWAKVKELLKEEKKKKASHSEIEERYGIEVELFALADVSFSEEMKKAFEKEKEAEAKAEAFNKKIEMAEKVIKLGASAQVALNAADISLDPSVKKEVVSVEGDVGVLGGLLTATKGGK